jgi:hypothetical protein
LIVTMAFPGSAVPAAPEITGDHWRVWTAPNGKFVINLPDGPISKFLETAVGFYDLRVGTRIIGAGLGSVSDNDPSVVDSELALQKFMNGMAGAMVVESNIGKLGSTSARLATIDFVAGGVNFRARVAIFSPAAQRAAILVYATPRSSFEGECDHIDRYFSSFRVLPRGFATASATTEGTAATRSTISGWSTWYAPNSLFTLELPDEPFAKSSETLPGWYQIQMSGRQFRAVAKEQADAAHFIDSADFVKSLILGPPATLLETHIAKLGERTARYAIIDTVENDVNLRVQLVLFVPRDRWITQLEYIAPRSRFDANRAEMEHFLASFRFVSPAAAPKDAPHDTRAH